MNTTVLNDAARWRWSAAPSAMALAAALAVASPVAAQSAAPSGQAPQSNQSPAQAATPPGGSTAVQPHGDLTPPPTVFDSGIPARGAVPTKAAPAEAVAHPTDAPQPADPTTGNQVGGDQAVPGEVVVKGRFVDSGAASATKLDIRVLDTPASVESYNGNFLKAIETTNVSDLYRYMTGIQRAGNTGYDISFRGFKTSGNDRNAILTDGLPGLSVRFGSPPTIGVDHIELVKGPTSVLYGQAQPGGFINIVTKKPKSTPGAEVELKSLFGVGPYNRQRGVLASVDVTGPIFQDGDTITARVVAEGGFSRGFRDFSYEEPIFFAPSIAIKPIDRVTITFSGEYRYDKSHFDTYLVAPNKDPSRIASINTSYQEKEDYLLERGTTGNVFVAAQITNWLKYNGGYRYVDHFDNQTDFDVNAVRNGQALLTNPLIQRRARGQENRRTYSFYDQNLTAKFRTFFIEHTLIGGISGGTETASLNRTQFYNGTLTDGSDVTLYNPVHNAPAVESYPLFNTGQSANLNWRYTTQKSFGAYGSDLIAFGDYVKVLLGGRYANERQTLQDLRIATFIPTRKRDTKFLPQAGLLLEPNRHLTFYGSYSTSYVPVAASSQDVYGLNPFVPTFAKSYEGGVKANLFQSRLNVTGAYFDIERQNVLNTFACPTQTQFDDGVKNGTYVPQPGQLRDSSGKPLAASGTCSTQLGRDRSRGFEIEVNATPLPHWQITGGYAHTKARVVSGSTNGFNQSGARVTNAPDDTFNFWSRYDFEGGTLHDLGLGLGVSYIGKRAGLLPVSAADTGPEGGTLPLPAYTTVDMGVYYKLKSNLNLTLKVTNLLDKRFIESAGFSGDIQLVPGTPRLLTLTARYGF